MAPTGLQLVRDACKNNGIIGYSRFAKLFRIYDDDRSKTINKKEFSKLLNNFGIKMDSGQISSLFDYFDKDGAGSIDIDEFIKEIRPNMSDARTELLVKAFKKTDITGDGFLKVEDLITQHDYKNNRKFIAGQWSAEEVCQSFLDNFQGRNSKDDIVTMSEFLDYYRTMSMNIADDAQFEFMVKSIWKV